MCQMLIHGSNSAVDKKLFLFQVHQPGANPMKLLHVKTKSEFYKFSNNESYDALFFAELLVIVLFKYK